MFPEISKTNSKRLYPIMLKYFISWGWATNRKNWLNFIQNKRLNKINFDKKTIYTKLLKSLNFRNIWTVDFIYNNLNQKKKYIYPNFSLTKNIGFDGSGINSKIDNSLRNTGNKNKNLIISKKVLYIKDLEYKQEKILSRKIKLFY